MCFQTTGDDMMVVVVCYEIVQNESGVELGDNKDHQKSRNDDPHHQRLPWTGFPRFRPLTKFTRQIVHARALCGYLGWKFSHI